MTIIKWFLELRLRRVRKRFLRLAEDYLVYSRLSSPDFLRRYSLRAFRPQELEDLERISVVLLRNTRVRLVKTVGHLSSNAQRRLRELLPGGLELHTTGGLSRRMRVALSCIVGAGVPWDVLTPSDCEFCYDDVFALYDAIVLEAKT
jgi:hypothetical protein